jgi:hypothetical protein
MYKILWRNWRFFLHTFIECFLRNGAGWKKSQSFKFLLLSWQRGWKNDVHMAIRDCNEARAINPMSTLAHHNIAEALSQVCKFCACKILVIFLQWQLPLHSLFQSSQTKKSLHFSSQQYLVWVHKFASEYGIGTQDPQISVYPRLFALNSEQFSYVQIYTHSLNDVTATILVVWFHWHWYYGYPSKCFYGSFLGNLMESSRTS